MGHKCKEHKLFQIDVTIPTLYEEITITDSLEGETPNKTPLTPEEGEPKVHQEEPIISLNASVGISAPQTLKL